MLDFDEVVLVFVIVSFFGCLYALELLRLGGWS